MSLEALPACSLGCLAWTRPGRPLRLAMLIALVTIAATPGRAAAEDLIGLYLTWRQDPTTTMTVNWVDIYADSSNVVWYRPVDPNEPPDAKPPLGAKDRWMKAEAKQGEVGPTTMQLRRVELTGLTPDALYEFGIGDRRRDVTHFWRFRTMPARLTRPIRFVEGGDMMHTRAMCDAMNSQMQKLDPDFTMLIGDLAYANGVIGTRWIDWLQSWRQHSVAKGKRLIPVVIGIGNHEVKSHYDGQAPDDAPYFYSLFSLPGDRSYYALDFGQYLSLVTLDSQHTQPIAGAQAEWLAGAMAERTGQQFVFVGYHYPAYGTAKGPAGGQPIDAKYALAIQKHWLPHLERWGVSAVFEHDHHNFKRTHRIRNRRRDDANGLLYLGDGAWGVVTRIVPDLDVAWWLAKAEPRNHLWEVELRPDGTARMRAIDAQGETFDEVELTQSRTTPE